LASVSAKELSIKRKPQAKVEVVARRIVTNVLENRQNGAQFCCQVLGIGSWSALYNRKDLSSHLLWSRFINATSSRELQTSVQRRKVVMQVSVFALARLTLYGVL
jgi:hypothetical protein